MSKFSEREKIWFSKFHLNSILQQSTEKNYICQNCELIDLVFSGLLSLLYTMMHINSHRHSYTRMHTFLNPKTPSSLTVPPSLWLKTNTDSHAEVSAKWAPGWWQMRAVEHLQQCRPDWSSMPHHIAQWLMAAACLEPSHYPIPDQNSLNSFYKIQTGNPNCRFFF